MADKKNAEIGKIVWKNSENGLIIMLERKKEGPKAYRWETRMAQNGTTKNYSKEVENWLNKRVKKALNQAITSFFLLKTAKEAKTAFLMQKTN